MEQAQHTDIVVNEEIRLEKAYEKYGWMILAVSAIFGVVAALIITLPPLSWFTDPLFVSAYSVMGALFITWVGFNLFALVLTLIPYRRDERWAWYTLWLLPLQWISQFVFLPEVPYLVLAVLTAAGLVLPYRSFFSRTKEPARVK
jgi:hypothetical protein